jgi:cytidylate kinase
LGGRGRGISGFKASLAYKVNSRTARAIQRNPVSKKQKTKTQKQKKKRKKEKEKRKSNIMGIDVTLIIRCSLNHTEHNVSKDA